MKRLFQLFKIQRSARIKKSFPKGSIASEKAEIKTGTKAYLTLPMTFDFTAYYDETETESNVEDNSNENQTADTNTEVVYINDEKCNEMLYSLNSRQFEC